MALDWKKHPNVSISPSDRNRWLRASLDSRSFNRLCSCFRVKLQSDISFISRMCKVIPKLLLMNPQKCRSGDDWNPLTFWKTCYSALYTDLTSSAATTTSPKICFKTKTTTRSSEVRAASWKRLYVMVIMRLQSHRVESNPSDNPIGTERISCVFMRIESDRKLQFN